MCQTEWKNTILLYTALNVECLQKYLPETIRMFWGVLWEQVIFAHKVECFSKISESCLHTHTRSASWYVSISHICVPQSDKCLIAIKTLRTKSCSSSGLLKAKSMRLEERNKYELDSSLVWIGKWIKNIKKKWKKNMRKAAKGWNIAVAPVGLNV